MSSVSRLLFAFSSPGSLIPSFVVGSYLQYVYTEVWGLPAAHVSLLWTLFNGTKLLATLSLGTWLDRTRLSRSLTVILSVIMMVAGFVGLWTPLNVDASVHYVVLGAALVVFGVGETLYALTRTLMFQELFDPASRAQLMVPQQICFIGGVIVAMILPPILSTHWTQLLPMTSFVLTATLMTSLSSVLSASMRPARAAPAPTSGAPSAEGSESFLQACGSALRHGAFVRFLLAMFFVNLSFNCIMTSTPLYIKYLVPGVQVPYPLTYWGYELDAATQTGIAQLCGQLASIGSTPVWMSVAARAGKARAWQYGCVCLTATFVAQYLLETGHFHFLVGAQILGALSLAPLTLIPPLIVSDLGDQYTAEHPGKSRTGFYQSMSVLTYIFSSVTQGFLSGFLLSVSGYDASATQQSPLAVLAINAMALGCPALFMALSALFMVGFQVSPSAKKAKTQ